MYYKVKVIKAKVDQVTTDGYLKFNNNTPWLYTKGEAIKKANMFGGKIVKAENVPNLEDSSMVILSGKDLLIGIKECLRFKELFANKNDINSLIYKGNIFITLLLEFEKLERENDDFKLGEDIKNQLNELCMLVTSEFVLINDMCFS